VEEKKGEKERKKERERENGGGEIKAERRVGCAGIVD
jgi:hypothetical protein